VGRVDLLEQVSTGNARWDRLDLSDLLSDFREDARATPGTTAARVEVVTEKNRRILEAASPVLEGHVRHASVTLELGNDDHAIGASLAGAIAARGGLPEGSRVAILATGYAGQGFGFGATGGMELRLEGSANDAVAEGMGGDARVIVVPPKGQGAAHLVGNAAAYGATGGGLYVAGRAGQRFGVRNSGAILVCEGVGKYAFEYMTGGLGIVLGRAGPCVGSGMTGGELVLFDPDGTTARQLSVDVVSEERFSDMAKEEKVKAILDDYVRSTGSLIAGRILLEWPHIREQFLCVRPR
jgi:glutamate synthase (NADPH/NADH) large chain